MPAFASLPDNVIRKLAEKSRTYEYLADKVIEDDTKSQETIYICKRVFAYSNLNHNCLHAFRSHKVNFLRDFAELLTTIAKLCSAPSKAFLKQLHMGCSS